MGNNGGISELWDTYKRTGSEQDGEILVEHYSQLVDLIARPIINDMPEHIDRYELEQAGLLGLWQAIKRYDPNNEPQAKFETFCTERVRGAIIDELRRQDRLPRLQRKKVRTIGKVTETLTVELGRKPTDEELYIPLKSQLSEKELQTGLRSSQPVKSLDTIGKEGNDNLYSKIANQGRGPLNTLIAKEQRQRVYAAMNALTRIERLTLQLYYFDGLTEKQIGTVLELTESRICQIKGEVCEKLRRNLTIRQYHPNSS